MLIIEWAVTSVLPAHSLLGNCVHCKERILFSELFLETGLPHYLLTGCWIRTQKNFKFDCLDTNALLNGLVSPRAHESRFGQYCICIWKMLLVADRLWTMRGGSLRNHSPLFICKMPCQHITSTHVHAQIPNSKSVSVDKLECLFSF